MGMNRDQVLSIVSQFVDEDTLAEIEDALPDPEEEQYQRCEDAEAARFEDAAHGYDLDSDHPVDPNTGVSIYDLDPGIEYNDAGEPKGYM
jgi:hypothetical protein